MCNCNSLSITSSSNPLEWQELVSEALHHALSKTQELMDTHAMDFIGQSWTTMYRTLWQANFLWLTHIFHGIVMYMRSKAICLNNNT